MQLFGDIFLGKYFLNLGKIELKGGEFQEGGSTFNPWKDVMQDQDEKKIFRMGGNNCKWSNWQRINLQNNTKSSCSSILQKQTNQSKNGQKA